MDENFLEDNDLINSAKKKKVLFVLCVDTSTSMQNKMYVVNNAIDQTIDTMKKLDLSHNIAKVEIAIMELNREIKWIPAKPQEISNFHFQEIQCSLHAQSNYTSVYQELNEKLQEDQFLKEAHDYHPIILLISDSQPTDDYNQALQICENNPWFHKAMRIALPIITDKHMNEKQYRDSVDYEFMMDFTGQKEDRIFMISQLNQLSSVLEIVTMTTVKHQRNYHDNHTFDYDDPFNDIRNKIAGL